MKKTTIGGQAVIEGVMMRGPMDIAVAVRKQDGDIAIEKDKYIGLSKRHKLLNIPIIRGVIAFFESLIIGTKTLMTSAKYFEIDEEDLEESKLDKFMQKTFGDRLQDIIMAFSIIISLILGIGLFMILPNFIAGFIEKVAPSHIILNIFEGIIRLVIFFLYIYMISKMKDIQRVFEYHGAEHKTIFCYESGEDLNVENVKKYSRLHPRCGTSFLMIVMVVSIFVFSFAGWGSLGMRIMSRLFLLPIVAGLSYEIIKWSGRSESKFACIISKPGMWFQYLTTREPDNSQIEVAIAAINNVIVEDKEADLW